MNPDITKKDQTPIPKDFEYYLSNPEDTTTMVPACELSTAFVEGYLAALHRHRVYDDALHLEGYQLRTHILGDLLFTKKKISDGLRACSRIVINHSKSSPTGAASKQQFTGIVLDGPRCDDAGHMLDPTPDLTKKA